MSSSPKQQTLQQIAQSAPSKENWRKLVDLLHQLKPNQALVKGLAKSLGHWPAWIRIMPADWFERIAAGEKQDYFTLATDADAGVWAYTRASATAYSHEMHYGFEFEAALKRFIASGYARHLLRLRTCAEGGSELYDHMPCITELHFTYTLHEGTLSKVAVAHFVPDLHAFCAGQIDLKIQNELWVKLAGRLQKIRILKLRDLCATAQFVSALFSNKKVQPEVLHLATLRAENNANQKPACP